jgi:hypothetical protein
VKKLSDNDEFLNYLTFEDLKKNYLKEKDECLKRTEYEEQEKRVENERRLRSEIRIDREHRKILNACLYPFAIKVSPLRRLGYRFLRAAPLLERGTSNLDFLIYKSDPLKGTAIFGEAKGSVSDPSQIVRETLDRKIVVESNRDYANQTYLGGANASYEYVLGVSSVDSNNVAKAVIRRDGGLIIWHSEKSQNPELTIFVPSETQIRASMMHAEDQLNKELGTKIPTSLEFKTFFQQSHIAGKLLILLSIDKLSADETFKLEDVTEVVERELNYIDDSAIILKEAQTILQRGIAIGFVGVIGENRYKIRSRYKSAASRETDLMDKWVAHRLEELVMEKAGAALEELKSKYRNLREKTTDLTRYL